MDLTGHLNVNKGNSQFCWIASYTAERQDKVILKYILDHNSTFQVTPCNIGSYVEYIQSTTELHEWCNIHIYL